MGKPPIKINDYLELVFDEDGKETTVIYDPPLLAETANLRVELRKEKNHGRPHVHIIKKSKGNFYEVSLALDSLLPLVGEENLKYFADKEYRVILEFLVANQDRLIKVYKTLKGEL